MTEAFCVKSGMTMFITYFDGAEFKEIGYHAEFLFLKQGGLILQQKSNNIEINLRSKL